MFKSPKMYYEEQQPQNGKKIKLFRKEQLDMDNKVKPTVKHSKTEKKKTTLSIYTYLNFKRFGLAVAIDEGVKITVLWFETHIKFEKR